MKTSLILAGLLSAACSAVEPLEPRRVAVTPSQTLLVALHPDLTTMVIFPKPVTMIVGSGLTDGSTAGSLQFDHRRGSAVVTFRPLQTGRTVYAQIMAGETVFFCQLKPQDRPDSVVTITDGAGKSAGSGSADEVFAQRLALPAERIRQLVLFARSAAMLSEALPEEFRGAESLAVSMASRSGPLETRIETIHRFPKDDAIIFSGTVKNSGPKPIRVSGKMLGLVIGENRKAELNWAALAENEIPAEASTKFEAALVGDGQGRRLHLSIANQFAIKVTNETK